MQMRSRQRGAGLLKLLFVVGNLVLYAIVGAKLFPIYSNHFKLVKAVKSVAQEGEVDALAVQKALSRRWMIEDIVTIDPKDIKVVRGDEKKLSLDYDYESRVHLFYNIDVVLTFTGSEPLKLGE